VVSRPAKDILEQAHIITLSNYVTYPGYIRKIGEINMKIKKGIVVASVMIVAVVFWGFDSLRTQSYSGKDLNFGIGSGAVTMTNPSDEAVSAQLVGAGSRPFSLVNASTDLSGSSVRDGRGQLFEFELPTGVTEFTIARGKDISFSADTDTALQAMVQPLDAGGIQSTLIAVAVVILGALFYMSRSTEHQFVNKLRGKNNPLENARSKAASAALGQGKDLRPFGDNRANTGD